jgi:hypothetical protein
MWPSARGASVRSQGPWRGASTSEDVRIVFRANATWTSTSVNSVFGAVSRHPSAEVGLRHRTPFHTDDSTKRQAGSRGERKRWWLAIDPLVPCSPLYASSGVPCRRCGRGCPLPALCGRGCPLPALCGRGCPLPALCKGMAGRARSDDHVPRALDRLALLVYRRDLAVRTRARPWSLPFLIAMYMPISHIRLFVDF